MSDTTSNTKSWYVVKAMANQEKKAREAISEEWGTEAAFVGCGGSIPIAGHFQQITGVDPMLIGFAKDDDQIHSPNEKYDLESFRKGIRSWVRVINSFSELQNV